MDTLQESLPVHLKIKAELLEQIRDGRFRPGSFLPSERMISESLRVSRDSARRALHELEKEGHIVCQRNRRPLVKGSSGAVPDTNSKTVLFLTDVKISLVDNPLCNQLHQAFLRIIARLEAEGFGYAIHNPANFGADLAGRLRSLCRSGFASIVYYPGNGQADSSVIEVLEEARACPSLVINGGVDLDPDCRLDGVSLDDRQGAALAARYLLEQGHRKIVHVTFVDALPWIEFRIDGFRKAMEDAGLEASILRVRGVSNIFSRDVRDGIIRQLEDGFNRGASAVFCANDHLAGCFLEFAAKAGVRVPDDVSLVGFDNAPFDFEPPLTTISQMSRDVGEAAARILMERMRPENKSYIFRETVEPVLLIKKSVRKIS